MKLTAEKPSVTILNCFRASVILVWLWSPVTPAAKEPLFGDVMAAVVELRVDVRDDARTAKSLGTEREGSGVVIDADGLIVTIGYLILEARAVSVVFSGGDVVPAQILAYDHDSGFGLIRAKKPLGITPMPLGDSRAVDVLEPGLVASYGGLAHVRPVRIVSRRVFAGYWEYLLENAIFTSPPHPLFGGAALINSEGELIGIGSLVVPDAVAETYLPGNMFVPIEALTPIIDELLSKGRKSMPSRPWLGIYSEEAAGKLRVARVADEGPAEQAGIESGDIIVAIAEQQVASMEDFYRRVWALGDAGVPVSMTVLKGAITRDIVVHSMDRYNWLRIHRTHQE
jgi:S1-C subfamily serine protease